MAPASHSPAQCSCWGPGWRGRRGRRGEEGGKKKVEVKGKEEVKEEEEEEGGECAWSDLAE